MKNICQGRPARTQNEERNGNGTGTERERNGTRTREMPVQHLRDSRLPLCIASCWQKKQMAIHNSYLLHLVIPSAFRAARTMQVVSFAFSPFRQENQLASFSNIFAFCYCHETQLGNADCGTRSFACLVAGKKADGIFFFSATPFWTAAGHAPCVRGRRLGRGGVSSRASARRSGSGGGSPSVWSAAPRGSSRRLAAKAWEAAQLSKAAHRRVYAPTAAARRGCWTLRALATARRWRRVCASWPQPTSRPTTMRRQRRCCSNSG